MEDKLLVANKDVSYYKGTTAISVQSLENCIDHDLHVTKKISKIIVPNNIFRNTSCDKSNTEVAYPIKPFTSVQIRVYKKNKKNDIVLEDSITKVPMVVCRMMYNGLRPWKIYTTSPNYERQKPSKQPFSCTQSNGVVKVALYTYAEIKAPNSNRTNPCLKLVVKGGGTGILTDTAGFKNNRTEDCIYTITSAGAWNRIVTMNGSQVASMETKSKEKKNVTFTYLTVSPNIDQCLMVCLSAICTYFDENTVCE
jgi:hypothetical protein